MDQQTGNHTIVFPSLKQKTIIYEPLTCKHKKKGKKGKNRNLKSFRVLTVKSFHNISYNLIRSLSRNLQATLVRQVLLSWEEDINQCGSAERRIGIRIIINKKWKERFVEVSERQTKDNEVGDRKEDTERHLGVFSAQTEYPDIKRVASIY